MEVRATCLTTPSPPRTATLFFTNLELRSAYNLIFNREKDEWKMTFSTMFGHYEYLVMPYGLANAPSVFQAFMNEVFQDMLGCQVVALLKTLEPSPQLSLQGWSP
jgi:hypothetical protein